LELAGTATAAANTFKIRVCDSDGTDTYSGGDGAATDITVFGAQVELGPRATSYYPTDGATASRSADQLRYKGDDRHVTASQGTLAFDLLLPTQTPAGNLYLCSINDGGSADEAIELYINTSGQVVCTVVDSTVTQATITSTATVNDNTKHQVRVTWTTNDIKLYVDGSSEGTDASCTIPTGLDRVIVGADNTAANAANAVISNLRILSQPSERY
jgi:hypothetical protein